MQYRCPGQLRRCRLFRPRGQYQGAARWCRLRRRTAGGRTQSAARLDDRRCVGHGVARQRIPELPDGYVADRVAPHARRAHPRHRGSRAPAWPGPGTGGAAVGQGAGAPRRGGCGSHLTGTGQSAGPREVVAQGRSARYRSARQCSLRRARCPTISRRPLRSRFGGAIKRHRLRREIVTTMVVNEMVDLGGITYAIGSTRRSARAPPTRSAPSPPPARSSTCRRYGIGSGPRRRTDGGEGRAGTGDQADSRPGVALAAEQPAAADRGRCGDPSLQRSGA